MDVSTKLALAAVMAASFSAPAMADTYVNDQGQRVECHDEQVKTKDGHPVAAPLAGAVVGGVVGHQFGGGRGQDIATAAGAVGGAYAGKKYNDNKTEDNVAVRQVCRPVG